MFLLVDNSNRTTKLALAGAEGIFPGSLVRLPSDGLSASGLETCLAGGQVIEAIVWSSVTAGGTNVLRDFARAHGVPGHALDGASVPMDLSRIAAPLEIGPDRLANALAGARRAPSGTVIAIDAGTAITFNVVENDGSGGLPIFLGGAIAPGLRVFTAWLHEHTARLPEIRFPLADDVPPAIATATIPAMAAAAWHGAAGMVRGILDAQVAALGGDPVVFLTGSDALALAAMLGDRPCVQVPLLTLEGLWEFARTRHP